MYWGIVLFVAIVLLIAAQALRGQKKRRLARTRAPAPNSPVAEWARRARTVPSIRDTAPTSRALPLSWFGDGATLRVAGFTLSNPYVYASSSGPGRYDATDPSEILIGAQVERPRSALSDMGYWPWYCRIAASHRYSYLEWLASGKKSLPPLEGMLFLYYYGLERRILVDRLDRELVLREVVRLRRLDAPRRGTREGRSFRSYSSGLLWFEVARDPEKFDATAFGKVCELTEQWAPEFLSVALSWLARQNQRLPASIAQRLAQHNPRAIQSVVVKRVPAEFAELFSTRYSEQYPGGIEMNVSRRPRRHCYRPASAGLNEVSCALADPMGIPSQFEPLADLWNGCVADLRRLSRVATSGNAPLTLQEWEATPADLRAGIDHPLAPVILAIVADARGTNQGDLPSISSLARAVGIEQRPRLTISQSRRLAQTIDEAGFAIEPDARMTGRGYGWNDPAAVFVPDGEACADATSYLGASCMLHLGMIIAQSDGTADEGELRHLTQHIESSFQLESTDRQRLKALKAVLLATGADLAPVARRLEAALSIEARKSVARLLVAIAAFDGVFEKSEESALRKCYRALGLGPDLLERTIADLAPSSRSDLVTVQEGETQSSSGERLPPAPVAGLKLDRAAISAIMAETRDVAIMLARAMEVEDDAGSAVATAPMSPAPIAVQSVSVGTSTQSAASSARAPDGRYGALYRALVSRERWLRAEADDLARQHGVMLAGAVETINDWAFDELGAPLLEDSGAEIIVDRSLL